MTSPEKIKSCYNVKYNLPHINQRFKWDCGVACILMILSKEQRSEFMKNFSQICQEEGFKQNTWTIDLCYLLRRYNIRHLMYTTRQAANERTHSHEERDRVRSRFKSALSMGITVADGAVSIQKLVTHIVGTGPAIVLVDAALLSCDWCKYKKLNSEIRRVFRGAYKGHYIVIVGWCADKLLYLDPARRHSLCATTPRRMQEARQAPGTDFDIILINNYTYSNITR